LVVDDPIDIEKYVGFYHDYAYENENVERHFCKRSGRDDEGFEFRCGRL